jgi:kynurenine formamidase
MKDASTLASLIGQSRIVDLTVELSPEHPGHWPGNIPLSVKRLGWYDNAEAPYFNRLLTLEEHTGTHVDAPPHFVPAPGLGFPNSSPHGNTTVEKISLRQLIAPACVIEASDLIGRADNGISPALTADRIRAWEQAHGRIAAGEIVLLRTGWTDRYYKTGVAGNAHASDAVLHKKSPAWPAPDCKALDLLIERKIAAFGTDCPSGGQLHDIVACHYRALGAGLLFVENLTQLDQLPPRGAVFLFLPLKIVGGSGAPGRAIALVNEPK